MAYRKQLLRADDLGGEPEKYISSAPAAPSPKTAGPGSGAGPGATAPSSTPADTSPSTDPAPVGGSDKVGSSTVNNAVNGNDSVGLEGLLNDYSRAEDQNYSKPSEVDTPSGQSIYDNGGGGGNSVGKDTSVAPQIGEGDETSSIKITPSPESPEEKSAFDNMLSSMAETNLSKFSYPDGETKKDLTERGSNPSLVPSVMSEGGYKADNLMQYRGRSTAPSDDAERLNWKRATGRDITWADKRDARDAKSSHEEMARLRELSQRQVEVLNHFFNKYGHLNEIKYQAELQKAREQDARGGQENNKRANNVGDYSRYRDKQSAERSNQSNEKLNQDVTSLRKQINELTKALQRRSDNQRSSSPPRRAGGTRRGSIFVYKKHGQKIRKSTAILRYHNGSASWSTSSSKQIRDLGTELISAYAPNARYK